MLNSELYTPKDNVPSDTSLSSTNKTTHQFTLDDNQPTIISINTKTPQQCDRFIHKITQLSHLNHPNLLSIKLSHTEKVENCKNFEIFIEHPRMHKSLADIMSEYEDNRICIFEIEINQYALAIAAGLEFLHSRHMTHNNLRPTNVLFSPNHSNICLLCIEAEPLTLKDKDQNHSGNLYSLSGLAPSIGQPREGQEETDYTKDLWDFGVLLLELCLLTSKLSVMTINKQTKREIIQECLNEIKKIYSMELVGIISRLLSFNPSARGTAEMARQDIATRSN